MTMHGSDTRNNDLEGGEREGGQGQPIEESVLDTCSGISIHKS